MTWQGLKLLFIREKEFSGYHNDSRIINNALYSLVITIIDGVITAAPIVKAALNVLKVLGIEMQCTPTFFHVDWSVDNSFIFAKTVLFLGDFNHV